VIVYVHVHVHHVALQVQTRETWMDVDNRQSRCVTGHRFATSACSSAKQGPIVGTAAYAIADAGRGTVRTPLQARPPVAKTAGSG
jgi:hypothetical protein